MGKTQKYEMVEKREPAALVGFRKLFKQFQISTPPSPTMEWGYGKNNGPDTWCKQFPIANGIRQSPINIETKCCKCDTNLESKPLKVNYIPEKNAKVSNTGSSIKIDIQEQSDISGGPLEGTYRLVQFHLHWGSTNDKGSEHTIDGKTFAAELHFVHYNLKYGSFSDAVDKPDGLAVLGFMIKVGKEHAHFKKITDICFKIQKPNAFVHLEEDFDPSRFLGERSQYWTYLGSLTTPPLLESVTWTVCSGVIEISQAQMDALRSLEFSDGGCMMDNYRPPVPLCGRTVRSSK